MERSRFAIRIKKILNNNAVIVLDDNREKVAVGSGIAFNKKKHDVISVDKIEKMFVMRENKKLEQLLNRIPEEHFTICEQIISYAEQSLGTKLNEHIHVVLTDHVSFAIERTLEGIHITNKLLQEIKIMYKQEFAIGLWALQFIKDRLQVEMPVDEAAFIALHLHTMKPQGGDLHQTVRETTIIRDTVQLISKHLEMTMKEEDLSYQRLITHLRFMLARLNQYELHTMDEEMSEMIEKKFPYAFSCAIKVAKDLECLHSIKLPKQELGYIALYIERLRKKDE